MSVLTELKCTGCGAPIEYFQKLEPDSVIACRYCGRCFVVEGERPPTGTSDMGGKPIMVTLVISGGDFISRCEVRLEEHGMRLGPVWGTNYRGWSPRSQSDVLLVAATVAGGPPFDTKHWDAYLPRPWPELVELLGAQQSAVFEGKTPEGNRLVVLCARSADVMRRAIANLQLGPEHIPMSTNVPLHTVPKDATRVTTVTPNSSYSGKCQLRLETLGYRPWSSWGTNFHDYQPSTPDEILLIAACADQGPPFDEKYWGEFLPCPWPELAEEIRRRGQGSLERQSPSGRRVVIVFGKSSEDLRQAIGAMHF